MKIRLSAAAVAVAAAFPAAGPVLAQSGQGEQVFESVVVTATRQPQRANEVMASVEVIDRAAIEQAGHSTLVDVLQAVPGIRVVTNGGPGSNASVFIRGAESRHTLLLVDGIRVGSATTGQPTLEAIPLAMIERIEILRGPASALYGSEAIGGVIQIFTRKGREGLHPEIFAGYGTYDTYKANASLSGGQGRLAYSITAGQDETKGFNAKRDRAFWTRSWGSSYDPDDDGFRNKYLSGSASLGFRESDEVGLNFFHSDGRNWYDTNDFFDSFLDKRLTSAGVFLVTKLSQGWTSTLRLGQSEDKLRNVSSATDRNHIESTQKQLTWQHDVDLPLGSLMAAYEYVKAEVGGDTDFVEDERTVHAFLLGWAARIEAHNLQVNVRHDDNSQFGNKTTGLLAYGYRITPQLDVHGSIATAFNAPTFNQLYWPDTGFGGGNPDLKPEKALNREVGLRWDNGAHAVDVTYYNNRVRDLIAGWPPQNVSRAKLEGVELAYRTRLAGFDLQAGFDYLNAKDEDTGNRLPRRARESGFLRVDRRAGAWNWGIEWNGQGRRYETIANTVALGGYGLLDAYAHYAFARDWRLEMRANNILDKEYELSRGYATAGANAFVGVRYAPH